MEKATFLKLLDKYLAGKASHEEEQQLLNFYGSFGEENTDSNHADLSALEEKMYNRLEDSIVGDTPVRTSVVYKLMKYSVAAAILIVSAFAVYFYTGEQDVVEQHYADLNIKNDILPGNNKAILTLADGSRISLDDAANGFVASQGNTSITKTKDGQIVYQKNGPQAKASVARLTANTIQTPKGGRYTISLPDGTKVWLNSASTLVYPTTFTGNERNVKLIGEAYFEVASNKKSPFRVESNNQVVEVLGTHFNINSYQDEAFIKTTLLEGSVRVILNSSNNKASSTNTGLLKPGEQSLTNSTQSNIKIQSTDTEKAVAWKNGYFKFKNTPIKEIMREIERWYDVELVYEGKISDDEFTGFVSNEVKISSVLKILEQSGGIKFTVKGRKLKIKSIQ